MNYVNEYEVVYSVIDSENGEILIENGSDDVFESSHALAAVFLAGKVKKNFPDKDIIFVVHEVMLIPMS